MYTCFCDLVIDTSLICCHNLINRSIIFTNSIYVKGSSDDFSDANIQLVLAVVKKLQERKETRACIVRMYLLFRDLYFPLKISNKLWEVFLISGVPWSAGKAKGVTAFQSCSRFGSTLSEFWFLNVKIGSNS